MAEKLLSVDMAGYLSSDEAIAECLTQMLADGDFDELLEQKMPELAQVHDGGNCDQETMALIIAVRLKFS